jgi:hypothetical protein
MVNKTYSLGVLLKTSIGSRANVSVLTTGDGNQIIKADLVDDFVTETSPECIVREFLSAVINESGFNNASELNALIENVQDVTTQKPGHHNATLIAHLEASTLLDLYNDNNVDQAQAVSEFIEQFEIPHKTAELLAQTASGIAAGVSLYTLVIEAEDGANGTDVAQSTPEHIATWVLPRTAIKSADQFSAHWLGIECNPSDNPLDTTVGLQKCALQDMSHALLANIKLLLLR